MYLRIIALMSTVVAMGFLLGCGSGNSAVLPQPEQATTEAATTPRNSTNTHLWGFYTVYVDVPTQTATAVLNRAAMFTANVVTFVNNSASNLGFTVKGTVAGAGYTDVDIDVTISHPFYGLPAYNGYDVRGVFIGDGSGQMKYNPKLKYPKQADQMLIADPGDPVSGQFSAPDGYTRWFNPTEFYTPGIFGYTTGLFATPAYKGKATLCPYKYYADGLTQTDDFWVWLQQNKSGRCVFSSGMKNTRNYYLRFPTTKGIKFNYAILANWQSETAHPANCVEAIACKVNVTDDIYYLDETYHGGWLIADITLYDWSSALKGGVMEDYRIFIESNVLSSVYQLSQSEMTPVASNGQYNTYHVEVEADNVTGTTGNEFWVIVEYPNYSYALPGGSNSAQNEALAAFFRFDLKVASTPINSPPVCSLVVDPSTPVPASDFSPVAITFDATGTTDPDVHDVLHYEWDFDGDGVFGESPDDSYTGADNKPTHLYYSSYSGNVSVRVTDGNTGEDVCTVPVTVTAHQSKNLPLRPGFIARDIAIDPTNGDLYVAYNDRGIWKYPRSSFYKQASAVLFVTTQSWLDPFILDITPNRYLMVGGTYMTTYTSAAIYDPFGAQVSYIWVAWNSTAGDIVAMGSSGSFANNLCFVHGYTQAGIKYNRASRCYPPTYTSIINHDHTYTDNDFFGCNKLFYDWIVGCESDKSTDKIWVLEDQDFRVSRWLLQASPVSWVYDNVCFGSGAKTESDEGFNDPQDITRDNQNRYFILDKLNSGAPVIKVWNVSGTPSCLGHFGDTTSISGPAARIEGSDYEGKIVVLHGSLPSSISVFVPAEMP